MSDVKREELQNILRRAFMLAANITVAISRPKEEGLDVDPKTTKEEQAQKIISDPSYLDFVVRVLSSKKLPNDKIQAEIDRYQTDLENLKKESDSNNTTVLAREILRRAPPLLKII